jgi:hypothetical protein
MSNRDEGQNEAAETTGGRSLAAIAIPGYHGCI